jgi:ketosteroid isomerase-like protein
MGASPEANRKLIHDYFAAVGSGATDKVVAAFADDVVWWVPPSSPMAGTYRGKDAVLGMFAKGVSLYAPEPMKIEILGTVADSEKVAAEVHITATTAKGGEYSNFYHFLFEIRDGKIAGVKEYVDTLYAQRTLFS